MGLLPDLLRVAGVVVGAGLAATGVLSPAGGALAAAALSVPGNAGADAIEKAAAEKRAREEAERKKGEADAKAAEAKADADRRAAEVQRELERQQAHAKLPSQLMEACRAGNMATFNDVLSRMDDTQVREIGLTPIAICPAECRMQVADRLNQERERRHIT
jgi:hypothetical protein